MDELVGKVKGIWKISGTLDKRYYFMPMTLLALAFWIMMLIGKGSYIFGAEAALNIFQDFTFYVSEILGFVSMVAIVYVNTRFYPWVAIVLSQMPLLHHVFKVDQSFVDSATEGYRRARSSVDRRMPRVNIQEYNVSRANGISHGRNVTNSQERTFELVWELIVHYVFFPVIKFFIVTIVFSTSFVLGWAAIPFALRRVG